MSHLLPARTKWVVLKILLEVEVTGLEYSLKLMQFFISRRKSSSKLKF